METRNIKILLLYLFNRINWVKDFEHGLCYHVFWLCEDNEINNIECSLLLEYIRHNRPKWYQRGYSFWWSASNFYWKPNERSPRVKWLKHHIKKNS